MMTKAQIEAFKKIKGPWGLKSCSHGGLIVVRGDGGPGGHEQSHVQIIPKSDAIAFAALPDLLAEREKMLLILRKITAIAERGGTLGQVCRACGRNFLEFGNHSEDCAVAEAFRILAEADWGEQGLTKRPISGVNNGELLDMEISMFGIRFYDRVKSQALRWLPWAELHRLAQQKALEQLGAAVAERSEPVCILKLCNKPSIPGRCLCALHAEECDRESEPRTVQIHGRDCDIGDCVCGLNEPRILPTEEK